MQRLHHFIRAALATLGFVAAFCSSSFAQEPASKPNILVIMADDIGYWNISAYNRGMMGYRTPNIDRISWTAVVAKDTGQMSMSIANLGKTYAQFGSCTPQQ